MKKAKESRQGEDKIELKDNLLHDRLEVFQRKADDFVSCITTVTTVKNEARDKEKAGFIAARLKISFPSCSIHFSSDLRKESERMLRISPKLALFLSLWQDHSLTVNY